MPAAQPLRACSWKLTCSSELTWQLGPVRYILITPGTHQGRPSLGPWEKASGCFFLEAVATTSVPCWLCRHTCYTSCLLSDYVRPGILIITWDERVKLGLTEEQGPTSGKGGLPAADIPLVQRLQREERMCQDHTVSG